MGLRTDPKVLVNDAIVVICLFDMSDRMTHHQFRQRAKALGFPLTIAQAHNMLHRATGYVYVALDRESGAHWWRLQASGLEYRRYIEQVIDTLRHSTGILAGRALGATPS